ncbi:hypothetical protein BC827DRAFT_1366492, partial [Russula dissimulans]
MSTTTPPRDSSLVPSAGTSVHYRSTTSDRKFEDRAGTLQRLAHEMGPFFAAPMPAPAFLNSFMPSPPPADYHPFVEGMFGPLTGTMSSTPETKWYKSFVAIITKYLKNLAVFDTSHTSDNGVDSTFTFKLQPDCSVYVKGCTSEENKLDFSRVDFTIEFKKVSDDPFVDDLSKSNNPFLCEDGPRHKVLGQMTAYATAILSAQYRTHLFMVLIVDEYARLIRWDRGGAVVTKQICFDTESHLFDFLIRY